MLRSLLRRKWFWFVSACGLLAIIAGLALLAAGLVLVPAGLLLASRFVGLLVGPVNVWNNTWQTPEDAALTGHYKLAQARLPGNSLQPGVAGIRLFADHRAEVTNFPSFSSSGQVEPCVYDGTGDWTLDKHLGTRVTIYFTATKVRASASPVCARTPPGGIFNLLGHSPPYRMWYYVTDPDEDMGLLFVRDDIVERRQ